MNRHQERWYREDDNRNGGRGNGFEHPEKRIQIVRKVRKGILLKSFLPHLSRCCSWELLE